MSGLLRGMVRLYPRAWRERYEEEFEALLEERPASASDVCDVALGAFDAWLYSAGGPGKERGVDGE